MSRFWIFLRIFISNTEHFDSSTLKLSTKGIGSLIQKVDRGTSGFTDRDELVEPVWFTVRDEVVKSVWFTKDPLCKAYDFL